MGFAESHSGVLGDIPGFAQLIRGNYESDKPINIPGFEKIHLKKVIDLLDLLLMVSENLYYATLLSINSRVIKNSKNQASNFL